MSPDYDYEREKRHADELTKKLTGRPSSLAPVAGSGFIVELQPRVQMWIAPWQGDPGRTCVEATAVRYKTEAAAKAALTRARRFSPFKQARIYIPNAPRQPVGPEAQEHGKL